MKEKEKTKRNKTHNTRGKLLLKTKLIGNTKNAYKYIFNGMAQFDCF